ncbi:MAG TPA: cytochrome P450 [Jatrophihabitantaceae bacterium]|jgi:cytochrome P450|nr:cytochrome P450 [Jatrophihabitantaceae bacterium]
MATTLGARRTATQPPGPKLPQAVQTVLFGKYRATWMPRLRRHYGDVFTVRIAPRNRHMVTIADPELIKSIFNTSSTALHPGEGNAILGPIMGAHSVLLLDEAEHVRVRQLLMPAFHGAPMRGYQDMITRLSRAEVDTWPVGVDFRTHDRTTALTLEIILQVVFGVTDDARLAELRPVVQEIVRADVMIMMGWFYPALQRFWPWRRFHRLQREFDRLLYAEIAARRTATDLTERTDVLSRLLTAGATNGAKALTDAELRDNLVTLLLAGHETTATALAWTFHELARNPDVLARAQQAADENDAAYLEAVVKESLRIRPVISEVARMVKEPIEVGGFTVPAGATIMPGIQLVQQDANNHREPERFVPSRYLDGQPAPNTWIPFGGGVRRCLGAGFSLMEATVVLGQVLRQYGLGTGGRPAERAKSRNITLTPARGGTVVLTRR